ncbi:hypothetical protein JAB4_059710 (plasmid) [Janthinobacterium sp. HH102]|uniref:hypothetical protein n=1 Tax=Janthinobacterium sp. HH102 TaxID=1537274 RepID=UPI000892E6DF|nr:hypothetical protein [Janthinobacterium sp. HH102]QOU76471.1 hypothetical protein JAB4_059710 [Janthinobacterium sp. HH102]
MEAQFSAVKLEANMALTEKDLIELRNERHTDYVHEARREVEEEEGNVQSVFGTVAAGTAIKLEGYPHTYFKTKDDGCYRYAEDNSTKVHMDFIPFAWPVEIVPHA